MSKQQETKMRAEVMLAFAEGKEIEKCPREAPTVWSPDPNPSWNWAWNDYRVAPAKPKRCKVRHEVGINSINSDPWGGAFPVSAGLAGLNYVEMIELTPEVVAALAAAGIDYEGKEEA